MSTEKDNKLSNEELHKEVVAGAIQVILFAKRNIGEDSATPKEAYDAGCKGRAEEAKNYIREFINDGLGSTSVEAICKVAEEDYRGVWDSTNRYLKLFGHEQVEPVEVEINT